MTNKIKVIQKGMNFDDLSALLSDVKKGELLGVYQSETDHNMEFFRIGSYDHIDSGDQSDEKDGPRIHLNELLEILIATKRKELKWGNTIVPKPDDLDIRNYGATCLNFGGRDYDVGASLLIGKTAISDKLVSKGLKYVAEAVERFELS